MRYVRSIAAFPTLGWELPTHCLDAAAPPTMTKNEVVLLWVVDIYNFKFKLLPG